MFPNGWLMQCLFGSCQSGPVANSTVGLSVRMQAEKTAVRNKVVTPLVVLFVFSVMTAPVTAAPKLKALIIDGQNNHRVWPKTTKMMKKYLEQTGLFSVDVSTTAPKGIDPTFTPKFSDYNVLISNYNGAEWPAKTQNGFVHYVKNGGGLVIVHAANNAFSNWKEYNEMIGLGGWGGRNEASGPYVYYNERGKLVRDTSKGRGGHHGPQHPFSVVVRDRQHPITRGMPAEWLHTKDELYDMLRGPATNMQILATTYADKDQSGTGRHEPMIFTVRFGTGRILHTPMGHADYSQECVGFIATLQRGTEWAATGAVTQSIPDDFPTAQRQSRRSFSP